MPRRTPKCNNCQCCPPCPLQYNEENCEVVWSCEDADEVQFIQPDEMVVDKTGTRKTQYNKKYQIRVTRFKDTPQECTADSEVIEPNTFCCEERTCGFCECVDSVANEGGTLPAAQITISGVLGTTTGDVGNSITNGFNGTFISAACADTIYFEENNKRLGAWYSYLSHSVVVDYPHQLYDGSYWMRVYGLASNHNYTGPYNNYHNSFACWKRIPFGRYNFNRTLDTENCPPLAPPTVECWDCYEWTGTHSLNVRHIKENFPYAWTLDPNFPSLSTPHSQWPQSCDFRNISVSILFL